MARHRGTPIMRQLLLLFLLARLLLLDLLLELALVLVLLASLELLHVETADRVGDAGCTGRSARDHVPVLVTHGRPVATLAETTEKVTSSRLSVLMHPVNIVHIALRRPVNKLRRRWRCQ